MRILLPLLALSCGEAQVEKPVQRPNILVFTLDTLRADALGAYGHKGNPSPNIDAMARTGYRFSRAYTVTPLTIPAHSSMHTSLWPPRHGVQDNGDFILDEGATTLAELLQSDGYQTMASVAAEVTSHHWGFSQGFDQYFDDLEDSRGEQKNRWRVERPAPEVLGDAMGWFSQTRNKEKPFFAWVHLFDIHHPYVPPEPYKTQFKGRPYLGEIAYTDAQVSGFLDQLRQNGDLDNTWIFILSDHGEGRGSHGEALHGTLIYNATTRIPFIVVPPKGDGGGQRIDFPTSIVDFFPTALSLAGTKIPDGIDGVDLTPWLKPEAEAAQPLKNRSVYVESLYAYRHYGWAPQKALVTDDHKLMASTTSELYDAWDLKEEKNLADSQAETLSSLQADLVVKTTAMVTSEGTSGKAELSEERLQQLAALGYLTTVVEEDTPTDNLPDPVDRLPVLREVEAARKALQSGELETAETLVDAILKKEPTFVDMRSMRAAILLRKGELKAAYDAAYQLDQDHPSTNVKTLIANIQMQQGKLDQAANTFDAILDVDPYLESAWNGQLTALFLSGNIPRLDKAVQKAKEKVPNNGLTRTMDGIVLVMRNELDKAEPILMTVLSENPNQPFANHSLGIIRRAQGKPVEAEQFLTEEIRLHKPAVPARRTLVEIYAEQKRYDEQLEQLAFIEKIEPPNVLTIHSKAQALFNLDRIDESQKEIEQCLSVDNAYPGCAMLLANVLKKQGKDDEAQAAYEQAMEMARTRSTIRK